MNTVWAVHEYEIEAKRMMSLLKDEFVFPDGSFFLEKDLGRIFPRHIFPDLGDFLPFFLYFKDEEFVYKQIELYKKQLENGLLVSEFKSFGVKGLVKSYEYTDLLLGLSDLYEMRPTDENKDLLLQTAETAINVFRLDSAISSYYYPKLNLHFPIVDTRDGTLIELFADLYELGLGEKYLKISENIFKNLTSIPFYKEFGILPTFSVPDWLRLGLNVMGDKERFTKIIICKNTTNSLFGFFSLAKTGTKEAYYEIDKILDKLKKIGEEIGGGIPIVYEIKNPKNNKSNLTASFPVIDFLCDLYSVRQDKKYIDQARSIADFWILKQGKTGLFPGSSDSNESFFDSETDMTVALYKLWELTSEEKYKISADKCFKGVLDFHGKRGYCLSVDVDNGIVTNNTQRTKFIALFLKLLILKIEYDKGSKIYNNKKLYNILRDR